MDFFNDKIAERLGGSTFGKKKGTYKFLMIIKAKELAKKEHPNMELIDMGVGEPDWPADARVVETLQKEAGLPENRWYADNGIPAFTEAAATYLHTTYGLSGIDPTTQIVHGIGSKSILAMLPLCYINPGDVLLTTVPGYPICAAYTKYLGGEVYNLPLWESNGFFPDFSTIPPSVLQRAKAMYINYPNNPTGATATAGFFADVVEFAAKNGIVVIHDAPYAALTYDGYNPLSFLATDGAMDVGVEVHSMSKAFNMTGWRMGFICGNPKAVQAYVAVKNNTDCGQFIPIQKAAITALQHPQITQSTADKYSRRFNLLVQVLQQVGFDAKKPKGSFFCYVKAPIGTEDGLKFETAAAFSEYLIRNALVSTVPWDDAGPYIRFSVTFEADSIEKEKEIMEELQSRLLKLKLKFK